MSFSVESRTVSGGISGSASLQVNEVILLQRLSGQGMDHVLLNDLLHALGRDDVACGTEDNDWGGVTLEQAEIELSLKG